MKKWESKKQPNVSETEREREKETDLSDFARPPPNATMCGKRRLGGPMGFTSWSNEERGIVQMLHLFVKIHGNLSSRTKSFAKFERIIFNLSSKICDTEYSDRHSDLFFKKSRLLGSKF